MFQKIVIYLFLILIVLSSCSIEIETEIEAEAQEAEAQEALEIKEVKEENNLETAKIYYSIIMHNEEELSGIYPDFTINETAYWEHHGVILEFLEIIEKYDLPFNFQSDWNFLEAMLLYDQGGEKTNGKNLLKHMYEDLGVEIDPHAHESRYNYADVVYLIEKLGVSSSKIVGGYIAYPKEVSKLHYFDKKIIGEQYEYEWQAEFLWGAGTNLHKNEEMVWGSGIWYPSSNDKFTVNDKRAQTSGGALANLGHFNSNGFKGLDDLLILQEKGLLEKDKFYTHYMTIGQIQLLETGYLEELELELEYYLNKQEEGKIEFVNLQEMIDIWEQDFDAQASVLAYEEIERYLED